MREEAAEKDVAEFVLLVDLACMSKPRESQGSLQPGSARCHAQEITSLKTHSSLLGMCCSTPCSLHRQRIGRARACCYFHRQR